MRKALTPMLLATFLVVAASSCSASPSPTAVPAQRGDQATSFALTSSAFTDEETIPQEFTCDGEDVSPPLQWSDPPQGTRSYALIMDDPDAPVGTWVHWVLYDLPADARALEKAVPPDAERPYGSRHGKNGWGRLGYGGPCPPSGTHRYFAKLYALDTALDLDVGANAKQVLGALEGHILAEAQLMGTYSAQ